MLTKMRIKTDLKPIIKTKDDFELETEKKLVKDYISDLMVLIKEEKEYLKTKSQCKPSEFCKNKPGIKKIKSHKFIKQYFN